MQTYSPPSGERALTARACLRRLGAVSEARQSLAALSDAALAQRIAEGDVGATAGEEAELYRRFAPRVRLFGRRHLRSEAACDDLVQEVLLRTFERLHAGEVRRLDEIGSFILGTCRMMAMSQRRVIKRRASLVAQFADPVVRTDPVMTSLDGRRLASCLAKLAERDRLVILLSFYADREAATIAEEIGATAGAVRVIRHRAIEHLRTCVMGGDHEST